jgi:hypothetical protein
MQVNAEALAAMIKSHVRTNNRMDTNEVAAADVKLKALDPNAQAVLMSGFLTGTMESVKVAEDNKALFRCDVPGCGKTFTDETRFVQHMMSQVHS